MRGDGRLFQRGAWKWVAYSYNGKEYREPAKTRDGKNTNDPKEAEKFLQARLKEKYAAEISAVPFISPASVNRTLQILGQAFNLALRRGTLSRAPYIRHLSEAGNARQGFFTEQELARVIERLPADLKDFTRFCAATGMRKGEASGLTWAMVEDSELHIPGEICKNRQARVLPLAGELVEIIRRRRTSRRIEENGTVRMAEFVFHRGGARIGDFKKSWATACVAAGVGRMVCSECGGEGTSRTCAQCEGRAEYRGRIFHDLRRFAVRAMVKAGINPQIAKRWSGHVSDSMFQRYSILTTDDLRSAFAQTEQYRAAEQAKIVPIAAQK